MVTECNEIFLDGKPRQNDSSVGRFVDCFCVCHLGFDVGDRQFPEYRVTKPYFHVAGDLKKLYCLEIFCVRIGAVGCFGRYLFSWQCISFHISPSIHCTLSEKIV
jgi:hypothetical protein